MAGTMLTLSTRQDGGKIGISRRALTQIVLSQIETTKGVSLDGEPEKKRIHSAKLKKVEAVFAKPDAVSVTIRRDGTLVVKAKIIVAEGLNPGKVCLELQEKIASALFLATERKKTEVLLELSGIGHGKR